MGILQCFFLRRLEGTLHGRIRVRQVREDDGGIAGYSDLTNILAQAMSCLYLNKLEKIYGI